MSALAGPLRDLLACLRGEVPQDLDWVAVVGLANQHLIAPHLSRSLQGAPGVPADVTAYLNLLRDMNVQRNKSLRAQLLEAARALNGMGLAPLVFKGAAHLIDVSRPAFMAFRAHRQRWPRPNMHEGVYIIR